ncbi:hypothetical protein FNV43_RR21629 [Rhamnella rubrinervis]|uniref:SCP domain-containing protein n=1 Tax=Rhamnella rubrinervis TaxID=2594499 RepID=A0A8K0GQA7_9ROSA|nr:hypothetical protein FNV43_RR21629 [Rhamnella rubrinervis]
MTLPLSKPRLTCLIMACLSILLQPSDAQNPQQDYINVHNAARAEVGVANITWDNNVATYAYNYVKSRLGDCNLVHSNGPYGENLAKGSALSFSGTTAVVWSSSVRLGCARLQCNNGWWFVSCNYDPPGNYVNEYPY